MALSNANVSAAPTFRGLVFCTAGTHRMGFAAQEVVSVEAVTAAQSWSGRYTDARKAFGLEMGEGRAVQGEDGSSVVVDGLEIFQDTLPVMGVPFVLANEFGKSLAGFVQWREQLWPVFRLSPFCAFIQAQDKASRAVKP